MAREYALSLGRERAFCEDRADAAVSEHEVGRGELEAEHAHQRRPITSSEVDHRIAIHHGGAIEDVLQALEVEGRVVQVELVVDQS